MKFKPYALLLLLLLSPGWLTLTTSTAEAQIIVTTPYEFTAGISGGATFSSVEFTPRIAQRTFPGMTAGLTGRMTMGKYVGLQLEINYAQQGWNEFFEVTDDNLNDTEKKDDKYMRRLNYLQLPFYTHVQFGGKIVKGFIHAGPQIGYFISESTDENLKDRGRPSAAQHEMPVEKNFEWGISGGAGIEFRTGIGYILLEGRYAYLFSDIYGTKIKDNFSKASGQIISAKVTYLIPFR